MGRHRSPEEVESDRLAILGPDLGSLFHALDNEVSWIHAKWKEFLELYKSPSTIDLLNHTAPYFFRVVQDMMWRDVVLHVARLTDPPLSMGKSNLTLQRLPQALPSGDFASNVGGLVAKAVDDASFARDWRNRHLAHTDLHLALGTETEALAVASRRDMEQVLSTVRDAMNAVNEHYWNSTTSYQDVLSIHNAESLVYYLRLAVEAEKKREDRWNRGVVLPEDLELEGEV